MQKIQDVVSECWEGMSIFEEEQQQLPQMRNWLWILYGRTITYTASCCPSAEASTWFWLCGHQPGTVGTMQRPRALLKAWDAVPLLPSPTSWRTSQCSYVRENGMPQLGQENEIELQRLACSHTSGIPAESLGNRSKKGHESWFWTSSFKKV